MPHPRTHKKSRGLSSGSRVLAVCMGSGPLQPKALGAPHAAHVHIARAQEVGVAVAYFVLQLAVAAEVAQVVAGEGVAQGILLPAVAARVPPRLGTQLAPALHPLRWAYFGRFFMAELCQQPRQRLVDGHQARATGLAVLR